MFKSIEFSLFFIVIAIIAQNSFAESKSPEGLMIELLAGSTVTDITDQTPEFSWIVKSDSKSDFQTAYRILVSSDLNRLNKNKADMWDTGKVHSDKSINIEYSGKPLRSNSTYYWKVKTWCKFDGQSDWSSVMNFRTANLTDKQITTRYPLVKTSVEPVNIIKKNSGRYLIDFGKVAFGYLRLETPRLNSDHQIEIHFGERGNEKGIITDLGRTTVRYYRVDKTLKNGGGWVDIRNPKDGRNTSGKAIKLPPEIGVICPFRYIELVNFPANLTKDMVRQVAVHYPFDENASSFESSSKILNDIWDLCKYSMKATSFCGVYVDGDRERTPYEADAYINQLSHYAVDREYTLARYSHEYLLENPTWPTEWKQHSIMMAWQDYMYTGNTESLEANYEILKNEKTLEFKSGNDGLLRTDWRKHRGKPDRDIVDWPPKERDGFVFTNVNTVINAFYYNTLLQMADIAKATGKDSDAAEYLSKAVKVKKVFNDVLFDKKRGVYVDGAGTDHASLHANMFPLAFGLVPKERQKSVADYVASKGMACSVYGAQYLMEALYKSGRDNTALDLMTSKDIRSWYNMLRVGSTITLEAWDDKFKSNQDWNHAWGAVPGNIIPRYLLGVRPLEPGFGKIIIRPQPASLEKAAAVIPTIRGKVGVSFSNKPNGPFTLNIDIPVNVTAKVGLPAGKTNLRTLTFNGKQLDARLEDGYLFIDEVPSGKHTLIRK